MARGGARALARVLAPGALISQEAADALDEQLEVTIAAGDAAEAARGALFDFVQHRSRQLPDDEAVDFWGDGRAKRRAACTSPGGMAPPRTIPIRHEGKAERKAARKLDQEARKGRLPPQANADERRHGSAHVSPGLMRQAERLREENNAAWAERGAQGLALNVLAHAAFHPVGVALPAHHMVDAFGDGLSRPATECVLPDGLHLMRLRAKE